MTMVNVKDKIILHAVISSDITLLDVHTHGLEKYNHPNFAVFAPSLFLRSATELLNSLADAVINKSEIFKVEEGCSWGEWGQFVLTEGVDAGEEPVLRIVPISPECDACKEGD